MNSGSLVESAQTFLLSNARLLERHLFHFLFQGGSRQQVLTALLAYQNEDGGFGNGLEPDKRTPSSQPIDQEVALRILDDIGLETAVVQELVDFLETITTGAGGVPFVLPTVADAPRAPWWNTDVSDPPASINPTASIAGFLHRHQFPHPWLERATEFCWRQIEQGELAGPHDFLVAFLFLNHVPERSRAEQAFERLGAQLLSGGHVALEPDVEGYVQTPLDYAPSPQSMSRRLFDDAVIERHLEALVQKQQADGGWPISWPAVTPACELEYRGVVTLHALKRLDAYGYLK